jgi:lipopolysaccharide export system protein LptC
MSAALRQTVSRALRVGLPLSALVLLSTIFLVSRSIDPNSAARIAGMDPEQMTRAPRIATARFAGVTRDATALTIAAQSVRSEVLELGDGPLNLTFVMPEGLMTFPNDSTARFLAAGAHLDQSQGALTADGPVTLENSDGYVLELGALTAALDQTRLSGTGGVTGRAPAGEISADAMELTRSGGTDGGYLLAFTGNVRLLYRP